MYVDPDILSTFIFLQSTIAHAKRSSYRIEYYYIWWFKCFDTCILRMYTAISEALHLVCKAQQINAVALVCNALAIASYIHT